MKGYSKVKTSGSRKSNQSQDFLDLPSPKHFSKTSPKPIPKSQIPKETKPTNGSKNTHGFGPEADDEGERGEKFEVVLSRASSVSSGSRRYKHQNNGKSNVQSAVKRAFSMSRSSSVSEKYSRIHDQCVTVGSPYDHDEEYNNNNDEDLMMKKMKKKKNRSGKILKACKSLFRF